MSGNNFYNKLLNCFINHKKVALENIHNSRVMSHQCRAWVRVSRESDSFANLTPVESESQKLWLDTSQSPWLKSYNSTHYLASQARYALVVFIMYIISFAGLVNLHGFTPENLKKSTESEKYSLMVVYVDCLLVACVGVNQCSMQWSVD